MPDLDDLFPGFVSHTVATASGSLFTRVGGEGPPLLLLHGFPQTMAMWHCLAPALARTFRVVLLDLPGYGWSATPDSAGGDGYSKRAMGEAAVAVMADLGHARFALAGHDRGARVGYRLALDQPGRLSALALLDILPTCEVWRNIEARSGTSPHWRTLAAPPPQPEQAIAQGPDAYFEGLMSTWAKDASLAAFDPRAMAHYRAAWGNTTRIHAMCEDYRAGATLDRQANQADLAAGTTIGCPVHLITSDGYLEKPGENTALDTWHRTFAPHATSQIVSAGHFVAEEAPEDTGAALLPFFEKHVKPDTLTARMIGQAMARRDREPCSRTSSVRRVPSSARPSIRVGRKRRWNARTTVAVAAS